MAVRVLVPVSIVLSRRAKALVDELPECQGVSGAPQLRSFSAGEPASECV
jgi:hypothetical protein